MLVYNKIRIFISSKCGGKYDIMRKALKKMLEITDLFEVYVFEDYPGSSQYVVDAYLDKIDDSDVCIFIIDNKDDVTGGVLKEEKRAKDNNKKLLYVFCDEDKKTPTLKQSEVTVKYVVVNKFSDVAIKAFECVMSDLVDLYKKKKININENNNVVKNEDENIGKNSINNIIIEKTLSEDYDVIKNELLKVFKYNQNKATELSEYNILCTNFLNFILCNTKYNKKYFSKLKEILVSKHKDELKYLIESRLNALEKYFLGEYNNCIKFLNEIFEYAINNNIPNWIINDIAIDIRNTEHYFSASKNKIVIESNAQKFLNDNIEPLYYPLIDRIDNNMYENLLKEFLIHSNDSPYTSRYGSNFDKIFEDIAQSFYTALLYGSITHVKMTINRLIAAYKVLCTIYDNHETYVELLRLLIINNEDKYIENVKRKYNISVDIINYKDIDIILNSVNTIRSKVIKETALCVLIKNFSYYFSDYQFEKVSAELQNIIDSWFGNKNPSINLGFKFIEVFESVIYRLDNDTIVLYILKYINNKYIRFFDEIFKLISHIDFENVSPENQNSLLQSFIINIKGKDSVLNKNYFQNAIINFIKTSNIDTTIIIALLHKIDINFHNKCIFELSKNDYNNSVAFIEKHIDMIKSDNLKQGENGVYRSSYYNSYKIIRNIIENNISIINDVVLSNILDVLYDTLISEGQLISAKNDAMCLLMYLKNIYTETNVWGNYTKKIITNKEEMITGKEFDLLEKDTIRLLKYNYNLLILNFNKYDRVQSIESLNTIYEFNDYEIIKILNYINELLYKINYSNVHDTIILNILQISISMSYKDDVDIRFYAIKCLLQLANSKYQTLALNQLSKIMDIGTSEMKTTIISRLKYLNIKDTEIVNYIIKKGLIDNNYLVKKVALKANKN